MIRRFGRTIATAGTLAIALIGCEPGLVPVPPGAQLVHVVVTGTEIRLTPATVRAGEVYLVIDTTPSSVMFVSRKRTAAESPGPMSTDDLARLARGDTEATSIEGFDNQCAPARAENHLKMGHCGDTFKVVLSAGKYALLTDDPSGDPSGFVPPRAMAVLEVLP
jgi:hypothetical protein